MKADYLIAEIGSTTTIVTAINIAVTKGGLISTIAGQGKAYTTVNDGDVTIGLSLAIDEIEKTLKEPLIYSKMLSTSSAAGGLRLTVHGLALDMTVKAAKEAALGAGGNIKMITAGRLKRSDIDKIKKISPNIIIISGGTDYGERDTALFNAEMIESENFNIPVIYCGNKANMEEIKYIFKDKELYITDNVYPRIDELNVEPTRKIIQRAFEKNIVKAPGMNKIHNMVNGPILPTPGAVMESAKALYDLIGDLLVIDVGGATTDVHSATEGSSEIADILVNPEPVFKRTVEGDLGVFINSENIISLLDKNDIGGISQECIRNNIKAIPTNDMERCCSRILTKKAAYISLLRHAGCIKRIYGSGNQYAAYGKDLSRIKYIIGTGGALIKLGNGEEILNGLIKKKDDLTMLPKIGAKILIDKDYIMASAGVLLKENKEAAVSLLKKSLDL
jgi:uncharacterized protein (TIGR01319 family)